MDAKEKQSKLAYNKIAENYDNTFDGRFTRVFKETLVSNAILKQNDAVLDVACGTGELLARLDDKCPIRGTGIDIAEEMIKVAQSKNDRFQFLVSSCAPLPFEDGTFDVLTVSAAFHHFPEPDRFAGEAFRVLKKGSRLYIAEVHCPVVIRQIMNVLIPFYKSGDVKIYQEKELKEIFGAAGFSRLSIIIKGKVQLLSALK